MSLQIGQQLGAYEITSLLGKGGMGEVYRARDLKLKRDVAIKVLPDEFSRDSERVARFQREAEVVASLNHPHIATIYHIEQAAESQLLVLELVEGETLADRIVRGPIRVDEALALAIQIAEALEAAHERGIIHRDLKPANIKITSEGYVKVLDFGLAKALQAEASNAHLSNSPTLSVAGTMQGVILGTAAYMSPEQAKGRKVDRRTDIFACGCVLYEMLTGRPAFEGEDIPDILSRVLQREPDWTLLPTNLSPRVRELLRLCLQKDIRKRRSDAADVRIDIEQALAEPEATQRNPRSRRVRLPWIISVAVVVALIVSLGIPAMRYLRETPLPEMRVDINTPQTSLPLHFALSPDGMRLVFVASGDGLQRLWIRSLDAVAAQPLVGTERATLPFWSPDGLSVGFFADGKLKRIDIGAGSPQELADAPAGRGGAWSRDGTILFAITNTSPLWRVPASGGQPVEITKLDFPRIGSHRLPQFLPDGRHFLFFAGGSSDAQGIYLGSLDGGETKRLTAADSAGAYMEPGLLVFNRQGALVARRLDVVSGALKGDPVRLAESVDYDSSFHLGGFSVSAAGRVSYRVGGMEHRELRWFDRSGKPVGVAGEPDVTHLSGPALSPDGRQVAVARDAQNNYDVWLMDLLRVDATRFTSVATVELYPVWSPDGMRIVFNSSRKGTYDLYVKPSSGAKSEEPLLESPRVKIPLDWSRDGRLVLYQEADPKTGWDLWAFSMSGDRKQIAIANTPFEERVGQFSPDVRWVAYQSNVTGTFQIYVQPFPGPGGTWKVSTAGGTDPRWRADGQELFFIAPDAKLMAASVQTSGSSFEAGSPVALFQTRIATTGNFRHEYDVSRDGRFLINTLLENAGSPITLLLNWKLATK
jgi:eukaryotic-like serine/threonine-protein kinase